VSLNRRLPRSRFLPSCSHAAAVRKSAGKSETISFKSGPCCNARRSPHFFPQYGPMPHHSWPQPCCPSRNAVGLFFHAPGKRTPGAPAAAAPEFAGKDLRGPGRFRGTEGAPQRISYSGIDVFDSCECRNRGYKSNSVAFFAPAESTKAIRRFIKGVFPGSNLRSLGQQRKKPFGGHYPNRVPCGPEFPFWIACDGPASLHPCSRQYLVQIPTTQTNRSEAF